MPHHTLALTLPLHACVACLPTPGAADGACVPALDDDAYSGMDSSSSTSLDDEVAERLQQAVELVAEMQLTAEQLKVRRVTMPRVAAVAAVAAQGLARVCSAAADVLQQCACLVSACRLRTAVLKMRTLQPPMHAAAWVGVLCCLVLLILPQRLVRLTLAYCPSLPTNPMCLHARCRLGCERCLPVLGQSLARTAACRQQQTSGTQPSDTAVN